MSKALFLKNLRAHWKLAAASAGVLALYFSVILGMYNPENPGIIGMLASYKLPPFLLAAFGFDRVVTELNGFLASFFYGMLMLAFPLVSYAFLANRLVAALVEKGSMATVLQAPITRIKTALTQGVFLICCVAFLVLSVTLTGLLLAPALFPGLLGVPGFLRLNLGALLLHLMLSGLCFFFSCLFSDTRRSLAWGSGLPILFILLHMLAKTGPGLHALRFLTPFSLYEAMDYAAGKPILTQAAAMLASGLLLYAAGVWVFHRKDLPL